jgi:hypothetical protein
MTTTKLAIQACARIRNHRIAVCVALLILVCFGLLMLTAPHAAAQGCAMCYQNAAASGAQGRAALRHGILILLLPALTLFSGIFVLIYRRRNSSRSLVPDDSNFAD